MTTMPTNATEPPHGIVLFDGVCNLCSGVVNFIIDRDEPGYFRFAAIQSEPGHDVLVRNGIAVPDGDPDSIVLEEDGRLYQKSTAALRIARHLGGAWRLLYVFIVVPRPIRDMVYRFVAHNRYRWFGRQEACRVPTPELRGRFLAAAKPAPV
jgi:predicted DCC family thiol-disulfide oxidoreductase YuxK